MENETTPEDEFDVEAYAAETLPEDLRPEVATAPEAAAEAAEAEEPEAAPEPTDAPAEPPAGMSEEERLWIEERLKTEGKTVADLRRDFEEERAAAELDKSLESALKPVADALEKRVLSGELTLDEAKAELGRTAELEILKLENARLRQSQESAARAQELERVVAEFPDADRDTLTELLGLGVPMEAIKAAAARTHGRAEQLRRTAIDKYVAAKTGDAQSALAVPEAGGNRPRERQLDASDSYVDLLGL